MADIAQMQALHEAAVRWWREVMSEPAVASYMQKRIEATVLASNSPVQFP